MYIDDHTYTSKGKIYRRILLRESYRQDGKVRHKTLANFSHCSDAEIVAMKLALKHKGNLSHLGNTQENMMDIKITQGLSVGALLTLQHISKKLGLEDALGSSREGKLSLWMVFAALIAQGSRLSMVRLAQQHAVCDVLGLGKFDEDDLYGAMNWLSDRQEKIEDTLFKKHYKTAPSFYLYDVTSSYFEGTENELADYGYNRDKKKGKKQIVVGLMTDVRGRPITVEVFTGNTQDTKTVASQIKKVAQRFGAKQVTFVGDRGMLKSTQTKELKTHNFHYITAITKAQITSLLHSGRLQLEFFDEKLHEVEIDGERYVLRRNPIRAKEIEETRQGKLARLKGFAEKQNLYLQQHSRAKLEIALRKIKEKVKKYCIEKWVQVDADNNKLLEIKLDEQKLEEERLLDGCYVLKTDLPQKEISTEEIHSRYKGLAEVESAFRTMKTTLLEMRAIYVRKANRTRAHVFVIMLAYLLTHHLKEIWRDVETTTEEAIAELTSICAMKVQANEQAAYQTIPKPRLLGALLLEKAGIVLPTVLSCKNTIVATRKKLLSERKTA